MSSPDILMIEPFYGGSHKQLIDYLRALLPADRVSLFSLPAAKWHWRARSSALHWAVTLPSDLSHFKYLFCSSVLNLCELVALRPELMAMKKIIYFHENQGSEPKI